MSGTRKIIIDGNGVTVSAGSGGAIGNITEIGGLPDWTRSEIEDTALDNTSVTTYILSNLKTYTNLTITAKLGGISSVPTENCQWTINFPGSAGSLTFWGQLMEQGQPSVSNGASVTVPLTIKPTNLNTSGAIIAPTFTEA